MGKINTKVKSILIILAVFLTATICGITSLTTVKPYADEKQSAYVEMFAPLDLVSFGVDDANYFNANVESKSNAPHGNALVLDYKVGSDKPSLSITLPLIAKSNEGYKGLAMWVDVPETADEYSFTMFVVKTDSQWQELQMGSTLTLVSEDGEVSTKNSIWKRQQLNGFTGWLIMPQECYVDAVPQPGVPYKLVFMIENVSAENAARTEDIKISVGSFGYYNDYNSLLFETAGVEVMTEMTMDTLSDYVSEIDALKPKNDRQKNLRNKMLVYFANIRENFVSFSESEKLEIAKGLYDEYYAYMEDYLYGEIRKTEFIMSYALFSDTHFTTSWINENFLASLTDAKTLYPNLSHAIVLGDISNEGISLQDDAKTELDNYYDWLDSYEYKNSKGEDIPIYNIMGNHDVRGPSFEGYPKGAYAPAVKMYLQREGVESLQWDMWINGYHFIFLNTDEYHSDYAILNANTIEWLDETLAENEDGRPIFVMIHQNIEHVSTKSDASMTFQEVIARHPTAIVSSGHAHAPFGVAKIVDDGEGVYLNQPAMVQAARQYYIAEVYEGGVIYRAREGASASWVISSDVVMPNADRANNDLFSANKFDINDLTLDTVTAEVVDGATISGENLVLTGNGTAENVNIPINAMGEIENYLGYSVYINSENPVSIMFDNTALKANAPYYVLEGTKLVEKSVSADSKVDANGYVVIPKTSINGDVCPNKSSTLTIAVGANETISIDKVGFYFNQADLEKAISSLSTVFYNYDGNVVSANVVDFGTTLVVPENPVKDATQKASYNFLGWDINGDGEVDTLPTQLKGNLSAIAIYEEVLNKYTYTFYDSDKTTVLDTQTVEYGAKVSAPVIEDLFGWDLDGDGAIENLPNEVIEDFTAIAILGVPPYENATVVFDPSVLSEVPITTYSYNSAVNLCKVNTLPVASEKSPTGKVVQYTYNYTDGTKTQNGSDYVQIEMPYSGDVSNFKGYAMWVEISATTEDFIGGLKINSVNLTDPVKNGWIMISDAGEITYADTKWEGQGTFPLLGKGFSGWIVIDKAIYANGIEPKADGYMYFQIKETGRTTPYTLGIGQVLMFSDKTAIINELSNVNGKSVLEYSFNDGNGFVYKSGQIASGESIIVPENPVHADKNMLFAGWDTNGDGYADTLPENGIITRNFNATALFVHVDAFKTFSDGSTTGWKKEYSLQITSENNDNSPTGKVAKLTIPANTSDANLYAKLDIKFDAQPNGLAVWMDTSNIPAHKMRLWINWDNKSAIADGGDYVYFYSNDGVLSKQQGWRVVSVPADFTGWFIMPLNAFANHKVLFDGDYLRFGWNLTDENKNLSGDILFGEAVTFNCTVDSFVKQIEKQVYGFVDFDGSVIKADIITQNNPFTAPANPVREGWVFEGWDIDSDGVVDTLPTEITGRTFKAQAVYSRQFTYKFVDEDGAVIYEKTAEYGSLILPPYKFTPKDTDVQYTYKFNGWKNYQDGMYLTENVVFEIDYEKTLNKYTVTFYDKDGTTEISVSEVEYGALITLPTAPEKDGFTFKGWDGYSDGLTVTGDISFVAIFEEIAYEPDNPDTPDTPDNPDKPDNPKEPEKEKGGCGSSLVENTSMIAILIVIISISSAVILFKKRS